MKEYHKIQTIFKRNPDNKYKTLLENEFSLPEFEYLKDNIWTFTEKVDGTNIRVMFDGTYVVFSGKTNNSQIPDPLVKKLQECFLPYIDKFVEKFGSDPIDVCLYGEGYGSKINSGGNYRSDIGFVLFDVKIEEWWLKREDVEDIANFFNLEIVPIIGQGTLSEMIEKTRNGFTSIWGDFTAEGIVARPNIELKTRSGHRIITKLKCKDFK